MIGEDVELVFFPDENLGWVWLDPNQLDQVLVNLAVNALENMEDLGEKTDLLLTDVVLPGMSGKELYEKMRENCPDLKVVFMSGYTEDTISHHGVLQEGLNFLQKPFRTTELRKKIRKVLDETSG